MIEAKYLRNGKIAAMIDEILVVMDDDMSDPMRQYIARWESHGNVIQPAPKIRDINDINSLHDGVQ
jgi:hypothetical protein|nr:hypothetical protein [Brucella anthropi]